MLQKHVVQAHQNNSYQLNRFKRLNKLFLNIIERFMGTKGKSPQKNTTSNDECQSHKVIALKPSAAT